MHLIRRSAFRAIASPSTSFISKSRSIATTSPFSLRSKSQTTISPIFRRFASNEVDTEAQKYETESTPSSADSEDQSSIASAISSATRSASTYVSNAAESLTENATAAKDTFVDTASGVAQAAGLAFPPSERATRGRPYEDRGRRDMREADPRPPLVLEPSNKIYIGNLLFEITAEDVKRRFSEFGRIEETRIAMDARGLSKGFAYITFDSVEAATAAIKGADQTVFEGRRVVVNYQSKTSRLPSSSPASKTLFLGNLPYEMSDADLNNLFKDVKNVIDVRVAIDRRTGQPRGFCHADFLDVESATKAIGYLEGKEFYGRRLRIDYSGAAKTAPGGNRSRNTSGENESDGY